MAHLLVLRMANSMVIPKKGRLGVHEQAELEITRRKYPVEAVRKGYNTPISSTWYMLDYRLKDEIIPEFTKDLGGWVLNPVDNNVTLLQIYRNMKKYRTHTTETVGPVLQLVHWAFKWINRKKTTTTILCVLGILTLSPFLFFLAALVWLNPLKPVARAEGEREKFVPGYNYNFIFGKLNDPAERNPETGEVYEYDVL